MEFLPFRRRPVQPAVVYQLPPRPNFLSDPTTRIIEVVLRMCPDSASPTSGGDRPSWFSKEVAFRSVFLHKDDRTNITVLFDGTLASDHWLRNYSVNVVEFKGGSDEASILFQYAYISRQAWADDTILYSLEDDYVHRPGWPALIREGLGPMIHPTMSLDYVTLYDHLDKYEWAELYRDLTSKIGVTKNVHWRSVPSTTNTWAALLWTFRADRVVFDAFKNQDNEKFKTLTRLGRTVGSCIPGWSTHVHSDYIAPCFDWDAYTQSLRLSEQPINELVYSLPGFSEESPHIQ